MGLDKIIERVYDNAARGCASSREPSGFRVRPGGSFLLFEGWCFGRRGVGGPALRPAPSGRWLRLGPRSVPRLPLLGPTAGPPLRLTRWAHGQPRPRWGRGPLSPARAPSGPLAGRSWVVAVARFRPPARRAPRRPWRRLSPFAAAGPPPRRPFGRCGSWAFRRPLLRRGRGVALLCPRRLCPWPSVLSPSLLPGGLPLSPSRPPPPPGAGEAQEVDARCGGDGRRPAYRTTKKFPSARGSPTRRKGTKHVFCSITIAQLKSSPLRGLPALWANPDCLGLAPAFRRTAREKSAPSTPGKPRIFPAWASPLRPTK